jgi:site-specific recombinase XerD
MDLAELLDRFDAEYLSPNSITPMRRVEQAKLLTRLAKSLDHPLDEINPQDVRGFIGAEIQRGLHVNSVRSYLGMIRSFVGWAGDAGLIDPVATLQLKSVPNPRGSSARGKPIPYKVSDVRRFHGVLASKYPALTEFGPGSRAMQRFTRGRVPSLRRHLWRHARRLQYEAQIGLALELGLRRIEIMSLSMAALHYDNDQVVVLTAKQGPDSKVRRAVPYSTHVRTCVQEWLDFRRLLRPDHEDPWLALTYTGSLAMQTRPLTMVQMTDALKVFETPGRREVGREWRWHRFRHTCATEWLRSGVPLEKVRLYMGHADLTQTLQYVEILDGDIDAAFGAAEADFARRLGLAA